MEALIQVNRSHNVVRYKGIRETSHKNRPRKGPYDTEEGLYSTHFIQPLFPHRPGVPDSYIGGLSVYCVFGGGAITMLFFGPLGPLTGLTLVGGGVGFEGAW